MQWEVLIAFLTGAVIPTVSFLIQSRREARRFRQSSLESRFNELTERLGHKVQFVRAGAIRALVDTALAIEAEHKDPDHRYLRRATKLLSTMLSTDEDQAVGFELIESLVALTKYAIDQGWTATRNEIVNNTIAANLAATRWFGDALCVYESMSGKPGVVALSDPRIAKRMEGLGLSGEQIQRAFERSKQEGRLGFEEILTSAGRPSSEDPYWAIDYLRRTTNRLSRTGEAVYYLLNLVGKDRHLFDWSHCIIVESGVFQSGLQMTLGQSSRDSNAAKLPSRQSGN